MIGGEHTSAAWQEHAGDVCVLPVGAFEQHDRWLPLATDTILAEHFARMVAQALDAALIPALPIGTSFEHCGHRGTLSLKPETAMAIVRDLVDELERQAFRILIIVNGHGGNFSYPPVVRDLNRQDRRLKIILVDPWTFAAGGIAEDSAGKGTDLHCGEFETSLMLAIRPDLVGARIDSYVQSRDAHALTRSDLNTFGIGHFNASGSIGFPSFASADKGRALLDSIRGAMVPWLNDRIARLRREPRYAGAGGIALRTMVARDVADGMRLKSAAGWNQTENDWNAFVRASPEGCFVAVRDGRVVGSAATIRYGAGAREVAWIGMVLVDPDERHGGIGTRLMRRALSHLEDCPSVKLDATPAGRELYLRLGFSDERPLARHACVSAPAIAGEDPTVAMRAEHLDAVAALDRAVTGLDRRDLVRALHDAAPHLARVLVRDGAIVGACLGRAGSSATQIGPVAAPDSADARALIAAALRACAGRAVLIDVPGAQAEVGRWLADHGFAVQRPLIRMWRGSPGPAGDVAREFAIVGPEFG
ncbi:MAG TPA: GNAT family N-acetyltransferase [Planctomycetota bacterium]|nr:GNAT family N-acetyltransferase [Planctomycetota bacterium]